MSLTPGARLGPYQVIAQIGVGGMGEVYRAKDTKLGREVALKVLPASLTHDAHRVARFKREAQVLASLNHPHIGSIHGLEDASGVMALVLELVEGPTHADRIEKGPIQLDEALPIAKQIAEALEAAHEHGVIHRDLKPSNVKVRPDGMVKVLDFGLAKFVETPEIHGEATVTSGSEALKTATPLVTQPGVILGTAAYMAPEQIKGPTVDRRVDIWAFGAVFFETLSGRRAFKGNGISETLAAILHQNVDWSALPTQTPAPVRRLISRCLERDVKQRLRDIGEARIALDDLSAGVTRADAVGEDEDALIRPLRPWWRRAMPAAIAAIVTGTLAGTSVWYLNRGSSSPPMVTRLSLDLPDGQTFTGTTRHIVAISPDGRQVVYAANARLYIRSLVELDTRPLQGTEGDSREPVFSPDGRSVAFYSVAERALKRVAVSGGAAVTISAADEPSGMSWGPDGIVFGQATKGIMRVSPDGGTPDVLVRTKDGQTMSSPHVLPGGTHVLFTLASGSSPDRWERAHIMLLSLTSQEQRTLIEGASDGRYVPTGHLVYALSGRLFAVAFDLQRLELTGDPVPIVEGVRRSTGSTSGIGATPDIRLATSPGAGEAEFGISKTGTLVYVAGPPVAAGSALMEIVLMDGTPRIEPLKIPAGRYATPRASRDGQRIAFASDDGSEAIIWTYNLTGTSAVQRLTVGGRNRFPAWTPDSQRVAFQSDRDGDLAIFWQSADGAGTPERLTKPAPGEAHVPESWHPAGGTLLFSVSKGSDVSLATLSLRDGVVTPFGNVHSSTPPGAVFSPDGRWVAYSSTEKGATTIYTQPFPATGARYPLVPNGSDLPHHVRWSPGGKELIYNPRPTGNERVAITTQPSFAFGNPVPAPRVIQGGPPGTPTPYDVMPDGRLLGFITTGSTRFTGGSANQVQVVLNWHEELKRLVPAN